MGVEDIITKYRLKDYCELVSLLYDVANVSIIAGCGDMFERVVEDFDEVMDMEV